MSTQDGHQQPPLRYRRFGGGYRREDVEVALTELSLTLRQLDADLAMLRDRNRELEGQLASARTEVEGYRAREQELSQTMAAVMRRATEIEDGASVRAQEIVKQAEETSVRVRAEASKRIEDASAQYNELLRQKDSLLDAMRTVVGDFDEAISRVARGGQVFPAPEEAPEPAQAPEPVEAPPPAAEPPAAVEQPPAPPPAPVFRPPAGSAREPEQTPARDSVSIPSTPPPAAPVPEPPAAAPPPPAAEARPAPPPAVEPPTVVAPPGDEQVFETRVELDVGPFTDFAALSAFERALAHLPKVEDVYVRRLAADRALIELNLTEVAPLLRTMQEALPYALDVKSANRSRIVMDIAVQAPAGAR